MSLRLGSQVGRYRIESVLGRGGMGVVYLATDVELKRSVAIEILAPELAEDAAFRDRFVREARVAASVEHPGIVAIYEAVEADGRLLLVMRYVPGEDLGRILRREAPLDAARTIAILEQVASALDAAHAHGLVHRDIKPANVLIQQDPVHGERAYLTDFGLTRRRSASVAVSATGEFVGTIDSVAPEQIRGGKVDGRADQYSLACLLFQALTGSPPFEGEHEAAILYSHLTAMPPRASERLPGLPREIDDVIAKGWRNTRTSALLLAATSSERPDKPSVLRPRVDLAWRESREARGRRQGR